MGEGTRGLEEQSKPTILKLSPTPASTVSSLERSAIPAHARLGEDRSGAIILARAERKLTLLSAT